MNFQKGAGLLVGPMKLLGIRIALAGCNVGCCSRGAGVIRLLMLKGWSSRYPVDVNIVWPGECIPRMLPVVSEWKTGCV